MNAAVQVIVSRALPSGGFPLQPSGQFDPASTAWAAIALSLVQQATDLRSQACRTLAQSQLSDGRVSVSAAHPETYWPTSVAVMAFNLTTGFEGAARAGSRFLLQNSGLCWDKGEDKTYGHDTSLPGWPWVAGTHSWVEPTALAVLALTSSGLQTHPRVKQAVSVILDRQIPTGGWNYGNTTVFGNMLPATPENTGLALAALSGLVAPAQVAKSIDFLRSELQGIRTPFTLSWGIIGLAAWDVRPTEADSWLGASFRLQDRYGSYDTCLLAQLIVASLARKGMAKLLMESAA
ncbi:MAG TPA: terpene cyclase/mutase family protein [Acidobacteriota bacterium]|nr:terpene cyclase/mutase family protein [Acidobacteriota bacterium]